MRARLGITVATLIVMLGIGTAVSAQSTTGSIAGVVRDATGAVLPGVTVEASSPALIEKVRVAVTDSQGNYKILDLRPGTYTVTFTLTGFSTLKREGIELSAGFTAPANADMKVGALEETITVTTASPVVDVQNVRTQQVLKLAVLEALPSGARDIGQFASLTLGAVAGSSSRNDVGGDKAENNNGIVMHGARSADAKINYDGMNTNVFYGNGGGNQRIYRFNVIAVQETVVDTGGNTAESETGGANINMVPKDGGNVFSVHSIGVYTNGGFASSKVSDDLIARGSAPSQNSMKKVYDYGFGLGGPIVRDRLWFYSANRWWDAQAYAANNYFNKSADWRFYVADTSRQAYADRSNRDNGVRVTWQAATKHKITASFDNETACGCWSSIASGSTTAPEATITFRYGPIYLNQVTWSFPATSRVLLQAGGTFLKQGLNFTNDQIPDNQHVSIVEQTTGYRYNALPGSVTNDYGTKQIQDNFNQRFSASYITGSHAFKVGVQALEGWYETHGNTLPNGLNYTFRNGLPVSLTQFATPFQSEARIRGLGVYGQDQYTVKRLTLNYGVRYDHSYAFTLPLSVPAGPFVPTRSYPAVSDLPNYKDLSPRVGAAYDVFGNGKTAIKGSWGRYLSSQGGGRMNTLAPANAVVTNVTRTWNDVDGDYSPDCVLTDLLANGECGQVNNLNFGQPSVNLVWDPASRTGWNTREYNFQYSVAVQHELRPGTSLSVGYYRTDWRNQQATVNTAVSPANYTPYCITAPTDARLGNASGSQICGLYDVNPGFFGRVSNVLMLAKNVPGATATPKEIFNGVDITANARFGRGGVLIGGVTLGRTTFDYCWENNLPNVAQDALSAALPRNDSACHVTSPLWSGVGSQAKLQFVYPLPQDFSVSGTFKDLPGIPITASYTVTNAVAAQGLGRSLSACPAAGACTATATVELIPFANNDANAVGTLFDKRLNELDLRLTRTLRFGRARVQGIAELYNVFNARPADGIITTYGATWLRPNVIVGGRLFKFGAQLDF